MILVTSELILTAEPGDTIEHFVRDAIVYADNHGIMRCILAFNGWIMTYDKSFDKMDFTSIVNAYYRYTQK